MTRITNRLGLPEPLVQAVANDPYDNAGTWSATTLLKPAQAVALTRKHAGEIVEDAADRIWSLMGQIGHAIIERAGTNLGDNWITERRFYADLFGERISGAADIIDVGNKTVFDYKFTSGWAVKSAQESGKSDWQMQLSILAMLARQGTYLEKRDVEHLDGTPLYGEIYGDPIEITHGKIVAVVRDWNEHQAKRDPSFPQSNVVVIDMNILPDQEVRDWIEMRLEAMKFAVGGGDVPCTDEERWLRPGKWAVYKGTNIKAAKLEDTEADLSSWVFANRAKLGATYRIEQRPSEYKRCEKYCAAAAFCPQYQSTKATDEEE